MGIFHYSLQSTLYKNYVHKVDISLQLTEHFIHPLYTFMMYTKWIFDHSLHTVTLYNIHPLYRNMLYIKWIFDDSLQSTLYNFMYTK